MAKIVTVETESKRKTRIDLGSSYVSFGNGKPIRFMSRGHAQRYAAEKGITINAE
jgi:hypothetical protein